MKRSERSETEWKEMNLYNLPRKKGPNCLIYYIFLMIKNIKISIVIHIISCTELVV